MPGWSTGSYGYHGDDGKLYNKDWKTFGPHFTTRETVGCGYFRGHDNLITIFFTLNGKFLGNKHRYQQFLTWLLGNGYENVPYPDSGFYGIIGTVAVGAQLTVNFGSQPFKFDIKKHYEEVILKTININKTDGDMETVVKEGKQETGTVATLPNDAMEEDIPKKKKKKERIFSHRSNIAKEIDPQDTLLWQRGLEVVLRDVQDIVDKNISKVIMVTLPNI